MGGRIIVLDVRNNLTTALRAALANPTLLDRELAGGGLQTLRNTDVLPVLTLELMPRCASCFA